MLNFETKNADDVRDYYYGMLADIQMYDDLAQGFSNPDETYFAAAIVDMHLISAKV